MTRWMLSLLALVSVTALSSCGPVGAADPLDSVGTSDSGSLNIRPSVEDTEF